MISILKRDILLSIRSGSGFTLSLSFFFLIIILIPLAIGPENTKLQSITPGILWISALLSCLLSLDRMFQSDFEDGTLEAFLLAPVPLEGSVFAKAIAHWLTTGLAITLVAPIIGFLYGFDQSTSLWMFLALLVGTPSLSFIGAFGASITIGLKRGSLLLPVLIMPFFIPTLIFGSQTVWQASTGLQMINSFLFTAGVSAFVISLMPFAAALAINSALK